MRAVHLGDAHGQSLSDTEMRRLPGDGFTHLDQTRSAACDSALARAVRASHVGIDAASQFEDPFDGSMNKGFEINLRHPEERVSLPAIAVLDKLEDGLDQGIAGEVLSGVVAA